MSSKVKIKNIFEANYTVPFFIITILTGLLYPAFVNKMNAEASERVIQVNKLSTAISDMNEKHNKDISELYKDSNQKYEKILNEISSVNQKVSRLEGKVMQ
jgi:hypothetical protein